MKKLLIGFGLVIIIGLSSCTVDTAVQPCYECTDSIGLYDVSICSDQVNTLDIFDSGVDEIKAANSDPTTEGYRATAEQLGYTCTQK